MADNIIKVNVTANKSQRVTVSSANVGTEITASSDTGKFWAQNAKNWAVSENIVDGEDYSSKYYANKSKSYAQNAESFEAATRETYDNFINLSNETTDAITGLKQTAVTEIEDIKSSSVVDINATVDAGIADINNTVNDGIADINNTKTTILNDIEFVADGEKEEILGLADEIKDSAEDIINRISLSMFDTVLKDHVLTYEESKGLALQGTYVYKNAVAGSRYGYADFYNKCLEEYNEANNEVYLKSNVDKVGSVIDNQGVLSGFSAANYATLPEYFTPSDNSWEFVTKITTDSLSAVNNIIGNTSAFKSGICVWIEGKKFKLAVSSNGTAWNIVSTSTGTYTVIADTDYWVKVEYTVGKYNVYYSLDNANWILDISVNSTTKIYQGNYYWVLGSGYIGGTSWYSNTAKLYLNESYININGSRWWSGVDTVTKNPNGHIFYDIAQKDKVDEVFASTGMAWMYGIDQENERIFLPRNNYFDQATGDITQVGDSVEAGLPNITGNFIGGKTDTGATNAQEQSGAFKIDSTVTAYDGGGGPMARYSFDASLSSSIYKDDVDTVQPNAVKKLLYICVGNTVSDTSWVDVVTQVEGGVKDLEDKTNEGLSALSNASNALRQTQITNCLLEVPQNIKLELNEGVLTLKAGSKVIVPNGFEADGTTPKFDYATIENDLILNQTANATCKLYCTYGGKIVAYAGEPTSGETDPATGKIAYNTTSNIVKRINSSGEEVQLSFPIATIVMSDTTVTSIEETFNGFGYIGSTIWVDKGVKGLIPNGRNEDGTLRNIEFTTSKVLTKTDSGTFNFTIMLNANSLDNYINYTFDAENNYNLNSNGNTIGRCVAGIFTRTNGVVSNFQPKLPFRAMDANTPHITETYVNGTSWYRIWSPDSTGKRWCEQAGRINVAHGATATVTLLKEYSDTNYSVQHSLISTASNNDPGDTSIISLSTSSFVIKSYETAGDHCWQVCGYIA